MQIYSTAKSLYRHKSLTTAKTSESVVQFIKWVKRDDDNERPSAAASYMRITQVFYTVSVQALKVGE